MVALQEAMKPARANLGISIARSHVKDLIGMENASLLGIWKAPACSLLEVIDNTVSLSSSGKIFCRLPADTSFEGRPLIRAESVDFAMPCLFASSAQVGGTESC